MKLNNPEQNTILPIIPRSIEEKHRFIQFRRNKIKGEGEVYQYIDATKKERERERERKGEGGKEKFFLYLAVEKQRCTLNRCTHNENR